ncbi:hypothetical protein SO802_028412 [Lithocarpus litseifolius]|uniref:Retrotransposon Copia-like N-terminal domain-containing protein n=1 Tax=Lithocarpus litseifolius TaxID=425828 RepID=A0AAW2BS33_9ROSI
MASNPSQNSSSSSSSTSAQRELSPMEDPRSLFFLHHGESPGAILVSQSLTEENYSTWARAMRMALDAKSKLGFVNGSITASIVVTPLEKLAWSKNNSMISSWILNSVSPHITASVIYRDTALEVWNALRNRFSQANGPRISQLQKQISTVMQGDSTVTSFFTGLQTAWDQLLNFRPLPCCACEERQRALGFNVNPFVESTALAVKNQGFTQSSNFSGNAGKNVKEQCQQLLSMLSSHASASTSNGAIHLANSALLGNSCELFQESVCLSMEHSIFAVNPSNKTAFVHKNYLKGQNLLSELHHWKLKQKHENLALTEAAGIALK